MRKAENIYEIGIEAIDASFCLPHEVTSQATAMISSISKINPEETFVSWRNTNWGKTKRESAQFQRPNFHGSYLQTSCGS
jgi:hypothetical protein